MSYNYTTYFNINELNKLKEFLRINSEKNIYTDHFTKYSIDLIDGYPEFLRTNRILGSQFDLNEVKKGEWVLYKYEHINELIEQGHTFPNFDILQTDLFFKLFESDDFIIYEKIGN